MIIARRGQCSGSAETAVQCVCVVHIVQLILCFDYFYEYLAICILYKSVMYFHNYFATLHIAETLNSSIEKFSFSVCFSVLT